MWSLLKHIAVNEYITKRWHIKIVSSSRLDLLLFVCILCTHVEKGIPRAGVKESYEIAIVSAKNWTLVLCKITKEI